MALIFTLTTLPGVVSVWAQVPNRSPHALESLDYRTGWILLGILTIDQKRWGAGLDPAAPYLTGCFEIVGKQIDRRKPYLPRPGDRIRLTTRVRITLLDYASAGERNRLESPARHSLTDHDDTHLRLESGAIVTVRRVDISPPYGQLRNAWARVSPPPTEVAHGTEVWCVFGGR